MARIVECLRCARERVHEARGLCRNCYWVLWHHGFPENLLTRRETLLEDAFWMIQAGETSRTTIAQRMGKTLAAFERAVYRAQQAGDERARMILATTTRSAA